MIETTVYCDVCKAEIPEGQARSIRMSGELNVPREGVRFVGTCGESCGACFPGLVERTLAKFAGLAKASLRAPEGTPE